MSSGYEYGLRAGLAWRPLARGVPPLPPPMPDPSTGTLPAGTPTEEGLATLNITFKPTATGPRTTVMSIKTKDGLSIGSVNLDGTGLPMPKEKQAEDTGCSATGHQAAPSGTLIGLLLAAGTLLLRRRRTAL